MSGTIFKSPEGKARIEAWSQRFLARTAAPVQHRDVPTKFGPSHVLIVGDTSLPHLVCLHGALATSAHIAPELGPLLDRYHVIFPDVPGQSVRGPEVRPSLKDDSLPRWLLEVCDGLGLGEINLCGASWGGFIAHRTAAAAPERIRRLILLVPAGIVTGSAWKGITRAALPLMGYKLFGSQRSLRKFVDSQLTTWDEEWFRYFGDVLRDMKLDLRIPPLARDGDFRDLKAPALVIAADEDISFPGRKLVARAKELIPHAEVVLLEHCKHVPPMTDESRRAFADRVAAFLA